MYLYVSSYSKNSLGLGVEVTVKTLKEFSANKIILKAENPNYQDIIINPNNITFDFEGTCVGLIRNIS